MLPEGGASTEAGAPVGLVHDPLACRRMSAVGTKDGRSDAHEQHLLEDLLAHLGGLGAQALGLGHEVEGAQLEGLEDVLALRVAADDDDRRRLPRHQDAEEGEPVHPRHLQVERDDVGLEQRGELERLFAVGRLAHDLDLRVVREHVGDVSAVVRRVVDDEEANGGWAGEVKGYSGSLPLPGPEDASGSRRSWLSARSSARA